MSATTTPSPEPSADRESRVAWLAAYALGLGFSRCHDGDCVENLRRAADADVGLLRAAHRQISAERGGDPEPRRRALDLLRRTFLALAGDRPLPD